MVGLAGWGEAGQAKQGKKGRRSRGRGRRRAARGSSGWGGCVWAAMSGQRRAAGRQATLILLPLFINCRLCWREGGLGEKVEPRTCACWRIELNLKERIGD